MKNEVPFLSGMETKRKNLMTKRIEGIVTRRRSLVRENGRVELVGESKISAEEFVVDNEDRVAVTIQLVREFVMRVSGERFDEFEFGSEITKGGDSLDGREEGKLVERVGEGRGSVIFEQFPSSAMLSVKITCERSRR